jgi:hypothetical protein
MVRDFARRTLLKLGWDRVPPVQRRSRIVCASRRRLLGYCPFTGLRWGGQSGLLMGVLLEWS